MFFRVFVGGPYFALMAEACRVAADQRTLSFPAVNDRRASEPDGEATTNDLVHCCSDGHSAAVAEERSRAQRNIALLYNPGKNDFG